MGYIGAPLYKWITIVDEIQIYVERYVNVPTAATPAA